MKNKYLNPILVLLLMASLLFIPYLYKGEITSSLFAYANKADELVLDDGSDLSRDALIDGTSPFIEGDSYHR